MGTSPPKTVEPAVENEEEQQTDEDNATVIIPDTQDVLEQPAGVQDPVWMQKKKAGKKLDPIEIEEYYNFKFNQEHKKLISETNYEGVPSQAQVINAIRKYHTFKKGCLMSFYDCQGNRHNKYAFAGPYDECGRFDVFAIWKQNVKEQKAKNFVHLFTDHYEVPLHDAPTELRKNLNTFYQGRYGIFTCHDTL